MGPAEFAKTVKHPAQRRLALGENKQYRIGGGDV
jgi:hypothetical protein